MRTRRLVFGAGLAVAALLACGSRKDGDTKDDNNFREDVIECEDALAKLEKCCPSFDAAPVLCNYYYARSSGCGSSSEESVNPALSMDETACIRATSCGDLVGHGVCARAQAARAYTSERRTSSDTVNGGTNVDTKSSTHPPVCP